MTAVDRPDNGQELPAFADSQDQCHIAEVLHADGALVWGVALVKAQQILDMLATGRTGAEPLHEWSCPSCGAVTRARRADQPDPGPQCPSHSHGADGWRCEHRDGHTGEHRNREVTW